MPLFAGARFYFPESTYGSTWRPYASAEVGPVIGYESGTEVGEGVSVESRIRPAFGARLGGGLDHAGKAAHAPGKGVQVQQVSQALIAQPGDGAGHDLPNNGVHRTLVSS